MKCPRCQHENPAAVKFCGECGARFEVLCPACRAANPPPNKFCHQCGGPLTGSSNTKSTSPETYIPQHLADRILASKGALEGERKQVTVLFADLKGSMELLADRDPEDARRLLDPVLERMMDAVHRYEGTVNQVMGDGIMALFGAPLAHEDHAVRACYAALRMQEAVKQYAEDVWRSEGVRLQIRVGLNSGEVVVRSIGSDLRMDYTAVGQTTHLAARMEQMADPGATLLTADALSLAEGFVQVRSLGVVAVKGLASPIEIFELKGASPVRSRLQAAAARGLTTFVGRDAEMDTLFVALEQAKTGKGQVVAVVGEPGVGKSRLFWEFTHSHRTKGCLVLETASVSYGKATTYLPVIDLLKDYFEVEPGDDMRKIRERLTGKLLSPDRALERCLAPLLWLLDVTVEDAEWARVDPRARRQRLLDSLRQLVLRETQVQPLVLVFEDLHWIDGETQAFLDLLMESLPTARLLLLVNHRPEYGHGWGGKTYYRQLRVDSLSAASADQLLGPLLGHDPSIAALKPFLIARTEGNPFFLEESVRSLVETGALAGEPGAYRLMKSPETLNIPATVQAILAARIDRLAPEDKRLIQTASVLGKDISYSLLEAIAEAEEVALRGGLARLQAAEFLYEMRLFPEAEYTFKHALTLEVAYGGLLQERRRALHARIVDVIESRYPDSLVERINRLAVHALRGALWDKALHYCRQVGQRDYLRRAYREGVTGYEQALEALEHLSDSPDTRASGVDLRIDLVRGLMSLGEHERALVVLSDAETQAHRVNDRVRLRRVLSLMGWVRRHHGDLDGALAATRQGLEIAVSLGDPLPQAEASSALANMFEAVGDYPRAAELWRRSLETLPRGASGPARDLAISSQSWLARVLGFLGEFKEGRRLGEEALQAAMREQRGELPLSAHCNLSIVYRIQGDFEAATRVGEEGLALARASDDWIWTDVLASSLGQVYGESGRVTEGLELLQKSLADTAQRRSLYFQPFRLMGLSILYRLAGLLDQAWPLANQALQMSRQQGMRSVEMNTLFQLGALHADAAPPNYQAADAHYRQALSLAAQLATRPLGAHCHLALGRLSRRMAQRAQAQQHFATATTMYREMDMRFYLEQAEAESKALS
jgi:class 3 adenylate cyclase/tetratricopeptide (TPR) repeat protein